MIPLVKSRIPELIDFCIQYSVAKLWILGSAVDESRFQEENDLDFLYKFDVEGTYNPPFPYAANWSDMLDDLRA